MSLRIGWYVHHHGAGHLTRARVVGRALAARGHEVTLLGSRLRDVPAALGRLDLPMDDEGVDPRRDEVTAGGRLHWAPLRHSGFRGRGASLAAWVADQGPDLLVVDVSVEMAMLGRLLGVPVVVVAQPGERTDEPHRAVYDIASAVLAPWPAGWSQLVAPHLANARAEVVEVGGISRLAAPAGVPATERQGVVLAGGEGFDDPDLADRITASVPGLRWQVLDGRTWVDDLAPVLAAAEVVVAHCGQNAVADIAAIGRPTLLLPQERPFADQDRLATALAARGLARIVVRDRQRDPLTHWAAEVEASRVLPSRWEQWRTEGAVDRAAELVERVGRG